MWQACELVIIFAPFYHGVDVLGVVYNQAKARVQNRWY